MYSDTKHAGLLLGKSVNSQISHSHTKGSLFGNETIAGFIGHVSGGSEITASSARVQVFSKNNGSSHAGGFVGILNGSTIENSFSTGNVRSDGNTVGGFVAIVSNKSQITESFSTGNVSGNERIGAFAGSIKDNINANEAAIENSYTIGNIITPVGSSAGFVGRVETSIIRNCYSHSYALYPDSKAGTYESASFVDLVVDDGGASKIEGSYSANYGQKTIMSNPGSNTVEIVKVELDDFNNSANFTELNLSVWSIDPHVGRPVLVTNPESEAYKLIHDADDFNNVRDDLSGYYVLAQDVDLSSYSTGDGWDAIGDETESVDNDNYPGAFKGILDGGPSKYTISGIRYVNDTNDYKALFATTDMASIRNLVIDFSEIKLNKYGGALVGRAMATSFIVNASSAGTTRIKCMDDCGGIVGEFSGLLYQVTNSTFVKGDRNVGGIVGDLVGISHLIQGKNSANVEGRDESFAGLVGKVKAYGTLISSSEHTGDIIYKENGSSGKRGKQIGGIIGNIGASGTGSYFIRIYKTKCKDDGSIKGNYAVGGLVGRIGSVDVILSVEKSYTTCNIEIADNPKTGGSYSGGLIGWIEQGAVEISESYSNSDITVAVNGSKNYGSLGGLIGQVDTEKDEVKEFKLENSYYIGDIYADKEIEMCGLLIGRLYSKTSVTKIFNTYAMGTLTNCVTEGKKERGLFGEENPKNLSSGALAGNIKHLYGYNDQLHVNNKHCADGSGNLGACTDIRGFTSDLNQDVGSGKWQESPNCTVFTGNEPLPELKNNPQVSGPKCIK